MTPVKSDPFCGLQFVSERDYGNVKSMLLRDMAGNFFRRTYINGRWSLPVTTDPCERAKIKRLYDDLTEWRGEC
jgi:hypothetical protein